MDDRRRSATGAGIEKVQHGNAVAAAVPSPAAPVGRPDQRLAFRIGEGDGESSILEDTVETGVVTYQCDAPFAAKRALHG